ncbi:RcnB family protein [Acinetobacter sp. S40]|uniref:RcnB family protein n=1 Tax=unclassified Acinetobacter TaxID=196816 RepID=UPI00190CABEA|nr:MULTISPECIES: RcnB family protein [unclassified Acinetobacter]MBJ9985518.1 RcnB family protein [Acinetobacter sp. S40]MBK0064535.1 RcnB family protein [Acinetobacter sp. S55]MBK0067918.1 RcnB family protein [Acinetobacter sp. S54]
MKLSLKMALVVLGLGISATSMAAPNDWNQYRGVDRHHHQAQPVPKAPPKWSNSNHDRDRYVNFRKGDRLPNQYRDNRYHVSNWRSSRLSAPPRGYHWVRADHRYLLVSNSNHRIYAVR